MVKGRALSGQPHPEVGVLAAVQRFVKGRRLEALDRATANHGQMQRSDDVVEHQPIEQRAVRGGKAF